MDYNVGISMGDALCRFTLEEMEEEVSMRDHGRTQSVHTVIDNRRTIQVHIHDEGNHVTVDNAQVANNDDYFYDDGTNNYRRRQRGVPNGKVVY